MQSPLPDSSALENGIIEDPKPTRLSRVQENVRHLLRNSVLSSSRASTLVDATPRLAQQRGLHVEVPLHTGQTQADVLPSPADSISSVSSTSSETSLLRDQRPVPGVLFPAIDYTSQPVAHRSTVFNDRAMVALEHPDLTDPSLAVMIHERQQCRQQRSWARSKDGTSRSRRRARRHDPQWIVCVLSCLLLAAIVACYIALTATTSNVSPTFHILFVLGIVLATVVFIYSVLRMCLFNRGRGTRFSIISPPKHRRHRHHRRHHEEGSGRTASPDATPDFVPPRPIQVHIVSDEVRPDSREAEPTVGVEMSSNDWDKDVRAVMNPPPAYGKWRGSVRADPELLHWQVLPSPTSPDTPTIPSPTYEEAMSAQMASYRERAAAPHPATRQHDRPVARTARAARVEDEEPQMIEARGLGNIV